MPLKRREDENESSVRRNGNVSTEKHESVALVPMPRDTILCFQPSNTKESASPKFYGRVLGPEVENALRRLVCEGVFNDRDFDQRTRNYLANMSTECALAGLDELRHHFFRNAQHRTSEVFQILRRVETEHRVPRNVGLVHLVPDSSLGHLTPAVSAALRMLFLSGVCAPTQFDDRAMDALTGMPQTDAIKALAEFAEKPKGLIRNPSSYWMGIVRNYRLAPESKPIKKDHRGERKRSAAAWARSNNVNSDFEMNEDLRRTFSMEFNERLDNLYIDGRIGLLSIVKLRLLTESQANSVLDQCCGDI